LIFSLLSTCNNIDRMIFWYWLCN